MKQRRPRENGSGRTTLAPAVRHSRRGELEERRAGAKHEERRRGEGIGGRTGAGGTDADLARDKGEGGRGRGKTRWPLRKHVPTWRARTRVGAAGVQARERARQAGCLREMALASPRRRSLRRFAFAARLSRGPVDSYRPRTKQCAAVATPASCVKISRAIRQRATEMTRMTGVPCVA